MKEDIEIMKEETVQALVNWARTNVDGQPTATLKSMLDRYYAAVTNSDTPKDILLGHREIVLLGLVTATLPYLYRHEWQHIELWRDNLIAF